MKSLPLVCLAPLLLLPSLRAREAAPDFSAFEQKSRWVIPAATIDTAARNRPQSNFDEAKVPAWTLPPLLDPAGNGRAATPADWTRRRGELLRIFRQEVFGVSPPRPENLTFDVIETDPQAMDGAATRKRIAARFSLGGESFTFHVTLFIPNRRDGPAPVFLQLNHRGLENTDPTRRIRMPFWPAEDVIARGYAIAAVNVAAEVDPDQPGATSGVRQFYRRNHPQAAAFTWATLAAWGWAGSRALDYLATDPDLDAKRVALIGHSRTGKAALWAAAEDERFALVCVNGAGEGGPAIARRHFGETLGQLTTGFPYWFTPTYAGYADRIDELPVDAHHLIALLAPRGYHGGDGTLDLWADPRGSWLALVEASRIWSLLGSDAPLPDEMPLVNDLLVQGPLAYHIREGGHDLTAFDWKRYLDHADGLFGPAGR